MYCELCGKHLGLEYRADGLCLTCREINVKESFSIFWVILELLFEI